MHELTVERNRRILIIDDSKAIHKDFKKILVRSAQSDELNRAEAELFGNGEYTDSFRGYDLASAYQGEQGLEEVVKALKEQRPYALAFVDMRMPPGWDGIETIERLWEADPELLIVICTAYSDYSWSDFTDLFGQNDRLLILKKPFDSIEVCQMASALIEKRYLADQAQLKMGELEQMVKDRTAELQKEIAERKKFEQELLAAKDVLQYQATHDLMTELWSRDAIRKVIEKELARCQREQTPLGIAFVDVDHFKRINDTYGHQAGDIVLCGVVEKLKHSIRQYDELGRYGGEEFIMVMPGCRLPEALEVSERARTLIAEQPFQLGDDRVPVSVSIGVTTIETNEAVGLDEIVQRADSALYQAKNTGRNCVEHYSQSCQQTIA